MKKLALLLVYLILSFITKANAQNCGQLLLAVEANDLKKVETLLQHVNPNCIYNEEIQPRTPLGMAAQMGNLEMVKSLVKAGAKPNYRFKRDASALMISAANGHRKVAEYLLQKGADINARIVGDGTPLIAAIRGNNIEIVRIPETRS